MAAQIPTFANLDVVNPQPSGTQPVFPQEDPGAAATAALGKGVEKAGGTLVDLGAYQAVARNRLNESNATLDLVNRLVPLHTQISTETDPAKIADLRTQYDNLLQTSSNAIDDPARRQAWMAKHANTILQAHADADKRLTTLDRGQAMADGQVRLDTAIRTGAASDDPNAVAGTLAEVNNNLEWMQKYGAITPEQRYVLGKNASQKLIAGRADYLINNGRPDEAQKLIDANRTELDPVTAETLRQKAETRGASNRASGAAQRALGLAPALPPRTSGGMSVGGAIPTRISQEAQDQGVDPNLALTTAQIESSMGQNLGSRGNIFQLGKPEWASVGGGPMGQPDADIKNGVAFLSRTQSQLEDALGRPPTGAEVYLAHQQGVGGAVKLLSNPSAPAGSLVPPQNIRANGGDPSMPASAFIGQWRDKFQKTAAGIGGSAPPAGASPGNFDMGGGDSIGVGFIKAAGLGGVAVGDVKMPEAALADAAGSRNPQQALDFIQAHPERFAGKTVLWSSGLMNAGGNAQAMLPKVGEQIDALKAAGANVVLAGVDTGKFAPYNTALQAIAESKGVPFAGPLPTNNVHPAPAGYKQYAANAAKLIPTGPNAAASAAAAPDTGDPVIGQPAPPPAAGAQQPQGPNRTGLPPLAQVWQSIQTDPTLRSDQERYTAFSHAKTMYDAQEADAARTERVKAARDKQALEARVTAIQKDAYSDKPTITARDIVNDPTFDSDPKLREHMIGFINNPPGSGVAAPQSQAAAYDLVRRINLPEGNPDKITDVAQLTDADTMRRLNKADFEFVTKQLNDIRAPGGERIAKVKEQLIKANTGFFTKSNPLQGATDPVGDARLYEYERYVDSRIDDYRKAGKDPNILFNPKSPDFVGDAAIIRQFQPTMEDSTKAITNFATGGAAPLRPVGVPEPIPPPPITDEDMNRMFPQRTPAAARLTSPQPGAVAIPGGVEIPLSARAPGETPEQYLQRLGPR